MNSLTKKFDLNPNEITVWGGKPWGTKNVKTIYKDIIHEWGIVDRYNECTIRGATLNEALEITGMREKKPFFKANYRGYRVIERNYDFYVSYFENYEIKSVFLCCDSVENLIEAIKKKVDKKDLYYVADRNGNEISDKEIYG